MSITITARAITIRTTSRITFHAYTDDPREAVAMFRDEHPGACIGSVDHPAFVGECENCECVLIEGDDYNETEDDCYLCAACVRKAVGA
ncbi:MAG: hypothetical protein AB7G11_11045 [Phycisphaerales bacterium]